MDGIPPEATALFEQASRQLGAGANEGAEAGFRAALALAPAFLEAQVNLAWTLERRGAFPEAEAGYRRALELAPACLEAARNLGVLLVGQKRFPEAQAIYDVLLPLHPDSPAVWSNLGALKVSLGEEAQAEACFRQALALDPNYAKARHNLGYLFLRRGRFAEGWLAHQARERFAYTSAFTFPCWRGEDLAGKSLLIAAEAGHGDMLQFCRYAAVLKDRGAAKVGILCHPPLKRLFATLDGCDQAYGLDEPLPTRGWDYWSLPLTLPLHCGTRLETIPAALPYLHPQPDLVESWRARVPQANVVPGLRSGTTWGSQRGDVEGAQRPGGPPSVMSSFKVGLSWKGNPKFETDADRSLADLTVLAPLWAVPGVSFVSLQKGPGEAEAARPPVGQPLLDLGSQVADFADTAAIMANLDLVVTVDTAAAHLAGALGKPCWVLLPAYRTDWRWLLDRSDSPWYPGVMRLFRQEGAEGWDPVIQAAAAALLAETHS